MKILKKKYKALGFVEALIAISVSGIVGVVLMGISASTLQKLHQLDIQDALAAHAVSTAVDLQKIAIRDATLPKEDKQFSDLAVTSCYGFSTQDSDQIDINPVSTKEDLVRNRDSYKTRLVNPNDLDSDYFRIFCISSNDVDKIIVEIIVGSKRVDGQATTDSDVRDYSYLAVINK